jgi:RimJ/RimL family protein N-acetyltransferase
VRELETERLILRRWRIEDREPFAQMNGDPAVMEFFPAPLTPEESDRLVDRIEAHLARHGFVVWAAERKADRDYLGYIGLAVPRFEAHFTPCVEIGWRLKRTCWGQGLATEGARAAARYGFEALGLPELVSFTVPANSRSRRVMEKIGMTRNPDDDFDHPDLPEGHTLRRHVLYRLSAEKWRAQAAK